MKKNSWIIAVVCILVFGSIFSWFIFGEKENQAVVFIEDGETLQTEKFIGEHLLVSPGEIRTNFVGKPGSTVSLLESSGLWLEYLTEKHDPTKFDHAYEDMVKKFRLKEGILAWEINEGKVAKTNALIDDLRIIEALFKEGETREDEKVIEEAINLSKAVLKYNGQARFFVDFYDTEYRYANEELTVSYVNLEPFLYMEKYGIITQEELAGIRRFMEELPVEAGFYPQTYDVVQDEFHFNEEINLIDQLYIVLHLERAGISTTGFANWLKSLPADGAKMYGRYDATTKEPTVEYQSVAVYALAIMYALERGDRLFAEELWNDVLLLKSNDGGYVDAASQTTHPFDNLLALLAERRLKDEGIIEL